MRFFRAFLTILPRFIIMLRSMKIFFLHKPFFIMNIATFTISHTFFDMIAKFCSMFNIFIEGFFLLFVVLEGRECVFCMRYD